MLKALFKTRPDYRPSWAKAIRFDEDAQGCDRHNSRDRNRRRTQALVDRRTAGERIFALRTSLQDACRRFQDPTKRLREVIDVAGVSGVWLATRVKTSPAQICRYRQGGMPRAHIAVRIARIFGLTVEELWGERDRPPAKEKDQS